MTTQHDPTSQPSGLCHVPFESALQNKKSNRCVQKGLFTFDKGPLPAYHPFPARRVRHPVCRRIMGCISCAKCPSRRPSQSSPTPWHRAGKQRQTCGRVHPQHGGRMHGERKGYEGILNAKSKTRHDRTHNEANPQPATAKRPCKGLGPKGKATG